VKAIEPSVRLMAQQGTKAYKQKYALVFRREATVSNEMWQSDHTPMDIYVSDAQNNVIRPWLTIILDDFSRAVAGYYIAPDAPATWKTALALRQSIRRKDDLRWTVSGIPDTFYTDHGSDFTSKRMELVAAGIQMRLINSQVGEPQGRGKVERFFRSVNELFLRSVPGFAPDGRKPTGRLITFERLAELFHEWLLSQYMNQIHSETGMTPKAKWESTDLIPRLPESIDQLDLLLCTEATTRKVHRDGIRFHGLRYMDVNLSGYVGELLTVRYDPRDLAEIRLYFRDDFVCPAVCQELAGQIVSLKAIVKARFDERKRVSNAVKESAQFLNEFIAIHSSAGAVHADHKEENIPKTRLKRYHSD
jgi:putative transposase